MYKRNIYDQLFQTIDESPVVFIKGARQSGKTTLVSEICKQKPYSFVTFDDFFTLANAENDPSGFVEGLEKPAAIDEVQRAPKIFLPIKKDVDKNRHPGRYLLTGSANPLVVPKLSDSLAGRMQFIHLWPLSQGEIRGIKEDFVDRIFKEGKVHFPFEAITPKKLVEIVVTGGFPDLQEIRDERGRNNWCGGYVSSLIQKDVTDLAKIEHLRSLPNILTTLANRCGQILNEKDVARTVGLAATTTQRYMQLLHSLYMIIFLPAWFVNVEKRLMKSPKIYFTDTALLLFSLGVNKERLLATPSLFGHALENFVYVEILKQLGWSQVITGIYHYRTHDGTEEVDIVLESTSGKIVGIEVKSSSKVLAEDFNGLRKLKEAVGKKFHRGIILYAGSKILPASNDLEAIPISALWCR
jgi:uncharacterized protein